jgi:hypothetical protein
MLLDRRKFITGSSLALVATGGLGSSRKIFAQSSGINPSVYSAGASAYAIACANAVYSSTTANDWSVIANTLTSIMADWQTNQIDNLLQPLYGQLDTSQVISANMNQQQILQTIQQFQPAFTLTNVQNLLSYINASQASIQSTVASLQQSGFATFLSSEIDQAKLLAASLGVPLKPKPITPIEEPTSYKYANSGKQSYRSAVYYPAEHAHLLRVSACGTAAALLGIASAVIFVMTLGAGALAAVAAWSLVSGFLGVASAGATIGAVVGC